MRFLDIKGYTGLLSDTLLYDTYDEALSTPIYANS